MSERFAVGVNYWPASSAMRWWRRFDAAEVDADFARVRAAGGELVRFFLLWEDFQPEPTRVSDSALERLVAVADTAHRHELRVLPTLFCGHMSGANFVPGWALGGPSGAARFRVVAGDHTVSRAIRNWYGDAAIVDAQALLARECARALAGHDALWGWDLGNENSNCCVPQTVEEGFRWLDRMTSSIRAVDASCVVTLGLHMEDLEDDRRIGPAEAARVCDVLCMHGYPIYAGWARSMVDSELVGFLADITRWLGGREVLFAEFGAPTRDGDPEAERAAGASLLTEDEAATYVGRAFSRVHGAGTIGGLVWCYGDYDRKIWGEPPLDRAPHERHFGLWRADGTPKPAAAALARWSGRARARPAELPWSEAHRAMYYRSRRETLTRLYREYTASGEVARPLL